MEQDLQPSDVLSDDPSDKTLEALRDAEVIPEKQEVGVPFPEYRARVLALLEQIAENTGGS